MYVCMHACTVLWEVTCAMGNYVYQLLCNTKQVVVVGGACGSAETKGSGEAVQEAQFA